MSFKRSAISVGEITGTDEQKAAVKELVESFYISAAKMKEIAANVEAEMVKGLKSPDATIPMIPTFLTEHPKGQEVGDYLALEVNGSTIRLLKVTLHGQGRITTRQQKHSIHENLKTGDARVLFDYLAECVDNFLSYIGYSKEPGAGLIQMGFTFSFPVRQTAVNRGTLIKWVKGFDLTGAVGRDVVELLQNALQRKHIPVQVAALVNGTVGLLLAHGYRSLDTLIACTFSTGTNLAYWENISAIPKWTSAQKTKDFDEEMIINTEIGSFGDNNKTLLPVTMFDNRLNRESVNPGVHLYEKMVSGFYLGELTRLIFMDLVDRRLLFSGQYSPDFNKQNMFETSYLSIIETDATPELTNTKHILETIMGIDKTSLSDRQIVKRLCEMVGTRAARLCACIVAAVMNRRERLDGGLTLCVDGSIFEHYPNFVTRFRDALKEIFGEVAENINIGLTRNGSGVGAAIVAMMVTRPTITPSRKNSLLMPIDDKDAQVQANGAEN